jgi:F-type H+-transporting ATPase subunit alpha
MGIVLFAANEGHLKDVSPEDVSRFADELVKYFYSSNKDLADKINETCDYNGDIAKQLEVIVVEFSKIFSKSH